jgi:drug/metabolite transporter (DMT)-like permease
MAALFLKQRLHVKDIVAMLLSLLGVVVISTRGNFTSLESSNGLGIALALGSSLLWASYWILNMRSAAHPTTRLALNFAFGALYSAIAATVLGAWTPIGARGLAGAAYVGVFEMGLTFLLWQAALKHARNASSVGSLVFLSPFLSLLVIALVLEESILPATVIGLALIVGGIALQQWWGKGKDKS